MGVRSCEGESAKMRRRRCEGKSAKLKERYYCIEWLLEFIGESAEMRRRSCEGEGAIIVFVGGGVQGIFLEILLYKINIKFSRWMGSRPPLPLYYVNLLILNFPGGGGITFMLKIK